MKEGLEMLLRDLIGDLRFSLMTRAQKDYYILRLRKEVEHDEKPDGIK